MSELTFWITPFTALRSLSQACETAQQLTPEGWHANLLLPTHYGQWTQAECRQSLPPELLVSDLADIGFIRSQVESNGLGFGSWGVPHDLNSPELAANCALESGYYTANFEPQEFWTPGDNIEAVNQWWERFWNQLGDGATQLNENVTSTAIPNNWGLQAFTNSAQALQDGCNAICLELYGGPNTSRSYPYPNLWPTPGFQIAKDWFSKPLVPILARENLGLQLEEANNLSGGRVEVWAL